MSECNICKSNIPQETNPRVVVIVAEVISVGVNKNAIFHVCMPCWEQWGEWVKKSKGQITCPHCSKPSDGLVDGMCAECYDAKKERDPGFIHNFTPAEHTMDNKCICGEYIDHTNHIRQ